MAKDFFDTVSAKAGFAGEYEALTETEIAAAPTGTYSPGEDGVYKVVASRVIQLLRDAPTYIETFQSSSATIRVPNGTIGTNDAEDGRFFFIKNSGLTGTLSDGNISLQKSDGTVLKTLAPLGSVTLVLHGDNNDWDVITFNDAGAGADGFGATFRYTGNSGIAGAGVTYLETGPGVVCSLAGDRLISDVTVGGISIRTDQIDLSRDYVVEVLQDPSATMGPPVVLATLALPLGSQSEGRNDLAVLVTAPNEIGVRITRTTGSGSSSFSKINVNVQVR